MFDVFLQNTFYKESCEKSSGDEVAVEWVWWFRASDVQLGSNGTVCTVCLGVAGRGLGASPCLRNRLRVARRTPAQRLLQAARSWAGIEQGLKRLHGRVRSAQVAWKQQGQRHCEPVRGAPEDTNKEDGWGMSVDGVNIVRLAWRIKE